MLEIGNTRNLAMKGDNVPEDLSSLMNDSIGRSETVLLKPSKLQSDFEIKTKCDLPELRLGSKIKHSSVTQRGFYRVIGQQ